MIICENGYPAVLDAILEYVLRRVAGFGRGTGTGEKFDGANLDTHDCDGANLGAENSANLDAGGVSNLDGKNSTDFGANDEICKMPNFGANSANLAAANIELVFVDSDEMREINREQRGIDQATDVLSFPYADFGDEIWDSFGGAAAKFDERNLPNLGDKISSNFSNEIANKNSMNLSEQISNLDEISRANFNYKISNLDEISYNTIAQDNINLSSEISNLDEISCANFATEFLLGSIVINRDLVAQKSRELGHSEHDETALLFLHGLLHVLGFDHERDSGQMRDAERAVIAHFGLPQSLIVRTIG